MSVLYVTEPDENRDWRDDPANVWCKVCDRGLEGCTHSPVDPESAIYSDPKTERVYARSPIGGTPIWGDRIGTCAVAIGFDLPDHRTVSRELGNHTDGGM